MQTVKEKNILAAVMITNKTKFVEFIINRKRLNPALSSQTENYAKFQKHEFKIKTLQLQHR